MGLSRVGRARDGASAQRTREAPRPGRSMRQARRERLPAPSRAPIGGEDEGWLGDGAAGGGNRDASRGCCGGKAQGRGKGTP
eukprot:scaffold168214_cov25-Tisochrysis_lutea.AAC.2